MNKSDGRIALLMPAVFANKFTRLQKLRRKNFNFKSSSASVDRSKSGSSAVMTYDLNAVGVIACDRYLVGAVPVIT